jgi:hypothetical protein
MVLVFPRNMISRRSWDVAKFRLQWRQELSRQANGAVQTKDLGAPIWTATFASYSLKFDDADALIAAFDPVVGRLFRTRG